MNKLTAREKILILVLVVIVVCNLTYNYLLEPQLTEYESLRKQIQDTSQKIKQAQTASGQLVIENKAIKVTEISLAEMEQMLARDVNDGRLFVKLDDAANESKVTITKISSLTTVVKEFYREQPLDITVVGTYNGVLSYLQWLGSTANWATYSELTQFVIEPAKIDTEDINDLVQANLHLVFYSNLSPRKSLKMNLAPSLEYQNLHNNRPNGGQ